MLRRLPSVTASLDVIRCFLLSRVSPPCAELHKPHFLVDVLSKDLQWVVLVLGPRVVELLWCHGGVAVGRNILLEKSLRFRSFPAWLVPVIVRRSWKQSSIMGKSNLFDGGCCLVVKDAFPKGRQAAAKQPSFGHYKLRPLPIHVRPMHIIWYGSADDVDCKKLLGNGLLPSHRLSFVFGHLAGTKKNDPEVGNPDFICCCASFISNNAFLGFLSVDKSVEYCRAR